MKQCPRCATPAPLDAPHCAQCGHQYRTVFTAPPASPPTQMLTPDQRPTQPTTIRAIGFLKPLCVLLVVLGIGSVWFFMRSHSSQNRLIGVWISTSQSNFVFDNMLTFNEHTLSYQEPVQSKEEFVPPIGMTTIIREYHVSGDKLLVGPPSVQQAEFIERDTTAWPFEVSADGQVLTLREFNRELSYFRRIR